MLIDRLPQKSGVKFSVIMAGSTHDEAGACRSHSRTISRRARPNLWRAVGARGFVRGRGRLAEIETDILYDTGAVINALPFSAGAYGARTPLMQELRRDGVDL